MKINPLNIVIDKEQISAITSKKLFFVLLYSSYESKSKLIKVETNIEKKERPFNQNKIRARYLRRSEK